MPLIELRNVGKAYSGGTFALSEVNLTVEQGGYVAIVGRSGSGKSTLLNILGLMDTPSSGTYLLADLECAGLSQESRAKVRADLLGFVFQAFHLINHRTVLENVMLGSLYTPMPEKLRRDDAMVQLDRVGMAAFADRTPAKLSGGEKQRVALARALSGSPQLLLCDEPTGNLDSDTTQSVLHLLAEINSSGVAIVLITHSDIVSSRARQVVRMESGILSHVERRA